MKRELVHKADTNRRTDVHSNRHKINAIVYIMVYKPDEQLYLYSPFVWHVELGYALTYTQCNKTSHNRTFSPHKIKQSEAFRYIRYYVCFPYISYTESMSTVFIKHHVTHKHLEVSYQWV